MRSVLKQNIMKKLKLILCCTLLCTMVFSQNPVYVVFTSFDSSSDSKVGVSTSVANKYFDPQKDCYPFITYVLRNSNVHYNYIFAHRCLLKETDKPEILIKNLSFLNTVNPIDWDILGTSLTKEQAKEKYNEIKSHDKIYFIDRNDFSGDTIKLVQVHAYESAY